MKVIAIAQARIGSTRFPGKVMRTLGHQPVLQWTIDALDNALGITHTVLATSTLEADDVIADYCAANAIQCFRGSESDVLDRFYQCALRYRADVVLRLTCDCPFLDPVVISEVVRLRAMTGSSYASNIDPPTYPDGLDVECFTMSALREAWEEAKSPVDRDCAPQFIVRNRHRFPSANLTCPLPGLAKERWVLDTEDDFKLCEALVEAGVEPGMSYVGILEVLDDNPSIRNFNKAGIRNERFYDGLAEEVLRPREFTRSLGVFRRSIQTIPFGTQTFSKSHIQFPKSKAPLYCTHGDGAYLFDVDGNRYVDLVNAVLPVVLGYRDPDVDQAIRRQLDAGISFSLGTPLEAELAELLCHHIPCAEKVKLGKSGTDVTTAAVRLARAITGASHVYLSGYHGWADWSMACTDRNLGIPDQVGKLSHRLTYGDREYLLTHGMKDVAAIVVEPNDNPEYLKWLRKFCTDHGIVLIFDEIITGFRYDLGGAQQLFGVTPDLATFGKAMGNGMPISALVGNADIMRLMEPPDNIFYSGTMFGETLSIAAAIATIKKIERENVIQHLATQGQKIRHAMWLAQEEFDLNDVITISGMAQRATLTFKDGRGATADQIRTAFMALMIRNGVLIINSNNVCFAVRDPEIKRIVTAYKETFAAISEMLRAGDIERFVGNSVVAAAPLRATA